jgi:hypothetical protein
MHLRYHAVSVLPGASACSDATALREVRLLSVEAPRLPMAGCDRQDDCTCRFRHHADRRAGPRRGDEANGQAKPWPLAERRVKRGRRETDFVD